MGATEETMNDDKQMAEAVVSALAGIQPGECLKCRAKFRFQISGRNLDVTIVRCRACGSDFAAEEVLNAWDDAE
jgi:hypothetical protein